MPASTRSPSWPAGTRPISPPPMKDYHTGKEAVRRTPSEDAVSDWIAQAKTMGRSIEY